MCDVGLKTVWEFFFAKKFSESHAEKLHSAGIQDYNLETLNECMDFGYTSLKYHMLLMACLASIKYLGGKPTWFLRSWALSEEEKSRLYETN